MKILFVAAMAALFLIACNSQLRQVRKLDQLVLQQPGEFARLSNLLNPCFSGKAHSDTVVVPGKNDTTVITNFTPGAAGQKDTLVITKKITVPVKYYIHDTVPDTRGLAVSNAAYRSAADSLIVVKSNNTRLDKSNSNLVKWVIGLALALAAVIGFGVYKFFTGGFIKSIV